MLINNAWSNTEGYHCLFTLNNGIPTHHWINNINVDEWQRTDTFLGLATYTSKIRDANHATGAKGFWLDIDVGEKKPYKKVEDAAIALSSWLGRHGVPKPTNLVFSGNGIHVYWFTKELIPAERWLRIAGSLKAKAAEINIDPARTSDIASVMRLPGSINYKDKSNPKRVQETPDGEFVDLEDFARIIGEVEVKVKETTNTEFPEANIVEIVKSCPTMKHCLSLKGAVEEPLWRGMLSVLNKCKSGSVLIHEFSKGDPRYNARETERKAKLVSAPYTCSTFRGLCDKCSDCNTMNLINSPIVLGFPPRSSIPYAPKQESIPAVPSAVPVTEMPKQERITESQNFLVTKDGIVKKGEEVEWVSFVPIWVVGVKEGKDAIGGGTSSIELEWEVRGRVKRGTIKQATIYEKQAFITWLSNHNLIAFVVATEKLAMGIKQFTQELIKRDRVKEQYDTLGWVDDSFVLGKYRVDKNGSKEIDIAAGSPLRHLQPIGTLEGWLQGLAPLTSERCSIHAFALMAGFGSPLLSLAGYQSAIISLAGKTNGGKTLSASLALSIYGNPASLTLAPSASDTMIEKQLECNKNVPFLLDEVSSAKQERVANLLYMISNGKPKESLNRNREARRSGEWNLTPFFTTNFPVLEMDRKCVSEAHRRRVIELYTETSIEDTDSAMLVQSAFKNYGNAAPIYIQNLCKAGKENLVAALKKIEGNIGLDGEYRFIRWTVASAILGGKLAQAMGLLPKTMNPEKIIRRCVKHLQDECCDKCDSDTSIIRDVIAEAVLDHYRNVVVWGSESQSLAVSAGGGIPQEPYARYDKDTDRLFIPNTTFTKILKGSGMSENVMKQWEKLFDVQRKSARIVPMSSTVRCVILECGRVGLDFKYISRRA